uniref:Uncharacterized protein n=1 Tax=Anguilla anguilla TaxID=7936 RepID=A0A0E9P9R1_ANGAN
MPKQAGGGTIRKLSPDQREVNEALRKKGGTSPEQEENGEKSRKDPETPAECYSDGM